MSYDSPYVKQGGGLDAFFAKERTFDTPFLGIISIRWVSSLVALSLLIYLYRSFTKESMQIGSGAAGGASNNLALLASQNDQQILRGVNSPQYPNGTRESFLNTRDEHVDVPYSLIRNNDSDLKRAMDLLAMQQQATRRGGTLSDSSAAAPATSAAAAAVSAPTAQEAFETDFQLAHMSR